MLSAAPRAAASPLNIHIAIDYRYMSGEEQNFLMTELARLKEERAHRGDSRAKRQLPRSSVRR
jgi:hypothetical protein